ncbi:MULTISPECIES: AAA family ATPase [Flavobacterium]|uniref:AAA family ATPase n=1 Tax=Flavobacterium jumunjinense TaxID=998845 RepID=A0ABV5GS80_9FLAO|nr:MULTISPECIES: AAA family ATPase [Flavobacterium]
MSILIDTVRISNFRGIKDIEVNLSSTTILVGANNAGKTSFLKALHLAIGAERRSISKEDFYFSEEESKEILIDIRIVSYDYENNLRLQNFEDNWATNDLSGLIKTDNNDYEFVCFRLRAYEDSIKGFLFETLELNNWEDYSMIDKNGDIVSNWKNTKTKPRFPKIESMPLFFIDAQRDIMSDLKDRSSYLGKLTERLEFNKEQIKSIEKELDTINKNIITESPILDHLKTTLEKLNKTVNSQGNGVEISPINKKIRDIGRNLNINFQDTKQGNFPLDYHGMGTRSWASVLTLNAFISWNENEKNTNKKDPFLPIIALEEPESHLHPNAQRHLFKQLTDIKGQKIISTHSPFIAAQSELTDLRHFYKDENGLKIGSLELSDSIDNEINSLKIEIDNNENNEELKKKNWAEINLLKKDLDGKINSKELKKIRRQIMNTRGELLFAKAIILFEGETEEQALPIFAEKYYGVYPFELGLNFIGVSGNKNYTSFLSIAKFLNIPWFIFSDADQNTVKEVKKQVKSVFGNINIDNKLIDLGDNNNFETYLVNEGFINELNSAIDSIENEDNYLMNNYIPSLNGTPLKKGKGEKKRDYNGDEGIQRALKDCLSEGKTKYASQIAESITTKIDEYGDFTIPTKIKALFDAINKDFNILKKEKK